MNNGLTLQLLADVNSLETMRHFVEDRGAALGMASSDLADVALAVNEMTTNVVLHGYGGGPGLVEIELRPRGRDLEIYVRDQAAHFDPTQAPTPDIRAPLAQRKPGGLGIHMTRHLIDSMHHRAAPGGGNELILIKHGCLGASAQGGKHEHDR